ncbi:MAG: ATP-binding cassette domain-containing protein [SAR86 cluster bacterium]|nr:ATP-binding cassette domain-containing protein [SAR86 cluster bacterium]
MLSFTNLALRRGSKLLFEDVSLTIHQDKKVGFVGANGTGKTSLFNLILGELESDQGNFTYPSTLRISYLAQELPSTNELSLDYVLAGDHKLTQVSENIKQAEDNKEYDKLGDLHDLFETLDGYTSKSKAEQLMIGLGFSEDDFSKSLKDFSGGWRVRLNLARALMQPSDLLLLDEPTNHLDLDAIIWLSDWIKRYQGAMILISHDRDFLDDCVDSIIYLHQMRIELFTGNYSQFEKLKASKLAEQESNYKKQQREVAHIQKFIKRFKAKATKARQAQSRIKALEKMELIAPAHIDSPFSFIIPESKKVSNPLLTLDKANLGYSLPVLKNVNIQLHPGDRIGLLGPNGAGKSTLIKSLVGEISLLSGKNPKGTHLKIGYFSQHQIDDLDLEQSAYNHIQLLDKAASEQEIRSFLGGFNFKGDKVKDAVRLFSGGEKARLALAMIAFQRPNLLLMDEPTNHLDMDMRQALTLALQSFEGALLLISHDRHLLANNVDRFLLLERGKVEEFKGDLIDYEKYVRSGDAFSLNQKTSLNIASNEQKPKEDTRQLKKDIQGIEKRLKRLHKKLSEVELNLSSSEIYANEDKSDLQDNLRAQMELKNEIEETEIEWLNLNTKLESSI